MTALNKQAEAGDVSQKTYYIHPAAFGGTKDPGHGHVPVVKVDDFEKLRAKLEAAEKRIAEHNFENRLLANADRDIKALRQRIAELENNEIRDDGNQFLVVRHPGKTPVIKHWSGDPEEFLRNLIEQDPLVTIDIITHRYYGVGGQWVQDADEYLHMMTAAGIGVKGE
ncbi:hypothetical protein ACKEZK_001526 [Citrobacter freundii]